MTTEAVSLRSHLKLDELPLATTTEGRKFVTKALHPADHEIKAVRVPGGVDNTVALQIDQVLDYPLDEAQTRIILAPDVFCPILVEAAGLLDQYGGRIRFTPTVFGGNGWDSYDDGLADQVEVLRSNFESLAITSESVTIEFTAPALSNQGTITALQFPFHPQYIYPKKTDKVFSGDENLDFGIPYAMFDAFPRKAAGLAGARAYNGKLTAGVYMPLRLDKFDQQYVNNLTVRGWGQVNNPDVDGHGLPRLGQFSDVGYIKARLGAPLQAERFRPLDKNFGIIYLDGYAAGSVSIRIRFRMTVEGRVFPGSSYAPLAEPPPPPDDLAMRMYREIAGRMQNAYPSSFNDWNKLKGTVLSVANKILPHAAPWLSTALSGLPYGGAISSLAKPILERVSKAVKDNMPTTITVQPQKKGKKKKPASLADQALATAAKKFVASQGRGRKVRVRVKSRKA